MASGSLLTTRQAGTPVFPAIHLTGPARINLGNSTQTPAAPLFNYGITGAQQLTIDSNGQGTSPLVTLVNFNAPNAFSSIIIKDIGGRGNPADTFKANVAGSLGLGNVTIQPNAAAARSPQLWIATPYAMPVTGTLAINGDGPTDAGTNKLRLDASLTVAGLVLDGVAQAAGTYGESGSGATNIVTWIDPAGSNSAILTVASPTVAYWDIDGSTAGSGGATSSGTWNASNTLWNPDADGSGTVAAWTPGYSAIFSAGGDAIGSYNVTVEGSHDIGGMTFEEGTVTLAAGTGGELKLVGDSLVSVAGRYSATVQVPIVQDATPRSLSKSGGSVLTISGNLSHTGVTNLLSGNLVLSGNNIAATGGTTITNGILQVNTANAIPGTAKDLTINSAGTLVFDSSFGSGNIQTALNDRVAASSAGVIAADNNSGASFDFNTAGLTAAYFGAIGNVTYTGTLTPNGTAYRLGGRGGTLTLPGSLTSTYTLALQGPGTVRLNGFSSTLGGLSSSGSPVLENGSASTAMTLTVNNSTTSTFGGTLQDGGVATLALIKGGTGTLVLNGANNYTGNTTISGGTLQVGTNNSANGAVLGGGSYAGNISIASGSNLNIPTNASQTLGGVISGAGNLVLCKTNTLHNHQGC